MRSNAAVYIRSCAGVTMPAWCVPVNGYVRRPAFDVAEASPVSAPSRRRRRPPAAEPDRRGAARGHAEEGATRDAAPAGLRRGLRLAHPAPVIVVVSRDSGSLTASTAAASACTSAGASLS